MKAEVWFTKPQFSLGLMLCYIQTVLKSIRQREDLKKTHVHVVDLEADSLDEVFSRMQQGTAWASNAQARRLMNAKGLKHSSMSVGDIIIWEDQGYMVVDCGFSEP